MLTVEIRNMQVYGHHGLYPGEEITGGYFEVNLKVSYNEGDRNFHSPDEIINYEKLVQLVKQRMAKPEGLLEKLLLEIAGEVKKQYPQTQELVLAIHKINPPVENFQGQLGVTLHKHF